MVSFRGITLGVAVAAVLVLGTASAAVAAPAATPATLLTESFEGALGPTWTNGVRAISGEPSPAAYWGSVSGLSHTDAKSFWCGGTLASGAANPLASLYPLHTSGRAQCNVDLTQYYSARFSFYYHLRSLPGTTAVLPDMGQDDSFAAGWGDFGRFVQAYGAHFHDLTSFPITGSGWGFRQYDLSDPSNTINLSRTSGFVFFDFHDQDEGPYAIVTRGQGFTIDDVLISGYKYGPVRSLSALRSGGNVVLNWTPPPTSTSSSANDARTIGYRVWRSLDSAPTSWAELTTDRPTALTFTDTSAPYAAAHYFVQAWDTGTGTGYGDPSGSSTGIPAFADSTKPVTNIGGIPGGWSTTNVTWSLAASDESWNTLTTYYRYNNTGSWLTYSSPVALSTEGTTTINYYSVDQAPNTETAKSATVKIDKNPPVTTGTWSAGTSNNAIVTLTPVDTVSGVAATHFTVDLGPVQSGTTTAVVGAHDITYWSVDVAGNAEGIRFLHVDPSIPSIPPGTARVAGSTRIDTALDASRKAYPLDGSAASCVVSNGYGAAWTDALPGSALAAAVQGPLILTHGTYLDPTAATEIQRLGVKTVYVVGNTTNLTQTVRSALAGVPGVTSVVSVGGTDVYSVSQQTAHQVKVRRGNTTGGTVFIGRSDIFADSLAASSLAANLKAPIILVPKAGSSLPAASVAAIQDIAPDTLVICGGPAAVSDPIATAALNAAKAVKPAAVKVRRYGGSRYDTALDLVNYGTNVLTLAPGGPDGIYVARGDDFPDALAGGVLAGASYDGVWRPLMITPPTTLASQLSGYVDAHVTIKWARVLGSNAAVSNAVVTQLTTHLH